VLVAHVSLCRAYRLYMNPKWLEWLEEEVIKEAMREWAACYTAARASACVCPCMYGEAHITCLRDDVPYR
jgi:hypothetical protein